MYYSRYYTSSYNYDAEQDYEDLLDQHEWIQREEADFEDYLERRDEQAKKDEQDFEDYLERRGEQAEKDERDFERYMAQSAVPAREVEQTYRLEGRVDPMRLRAKCAVCHHAPANTVCTPCSHTAPVVDCCDTFSVKREARCPVCKTAVVDPVLRA